MNASTTITAIPARAAPSIGPTDRDDARCAGGAPLHARSNSRKCLAFDIDPPRNDHSNRRGYLMVMNPSFTVAAGKVVVPRRSVRFPVPSGFVTTTTVNGTSGKG